MLSIEIVSQEKQVQKAFVKGLYIIQQSTCPSGLSSGLPFEPYILVLSLI